MPKMTKLGEYGINPALSIAQDEGKKIQVFQLSDSSEWFGINTLSELEEADRRKAISNYLCSEFYLYLCAELLPILAKTGAVQSTCFDESDKK
jgi:hypothetical protein